MIQKVLSILFIFSYSIILGNDIHLNFLKITIDDGLSDDRYNDYIYEDSRGFVWISSIDGLNRYDGSNIKTYRYESGMKGSNIQSNFFEDKEGNIWFTTYEAINCYNARLDSIVNYQINDERNAKITNGYRAFHLDTLTNQLWLKANDLLYQWSIDRIGKFELLPVESKAYFYSVGLDEDGSLNKILAYTSRDSVRYIYVNKNYKYKDFKIPNTGKSIHLQDTKRLFYKKDKLLVFDESKPHELIQLKSKGKTVITDVIKHKGDSLYILTKNDGLWLYNWKDEKIIKQWKSSKTNKFSMLSNSPRKLHLSPSNYLWTSHKNRGINYAYSHNNNFSNPLNSLLEKNVEVTSIIEDYNRNIWVGTKFNGIYIFKPSGEKVHQYNYPLSNSDNSEFWNICANRKGDIFGTTSKAVYQFNLVKKEVKSIIPNSDTLIFLFMKPLFENRNFISSNKGLLELNNDRKGNYKLKYFTELSKQKEFSFIQMFKTKSNRVFMPYNTSSLWIYEASKDSLKLIAKNDTCNLQFYGFCESKKQAGIIWVGTSKGLKKINEQNEIKSVFSDNSELAKGNAYGIVEDKKGILWITTNRGLWKYNPNQPNEKPIHFEEADGLSGELFSLYHSAILASDGSVWLGNNKGLVKFHPDSIKVHKEIPKLHLEELLVNDTKSFRKKIINNTLVLKHNQNTLTFDIKAVNLYKTKRNKIYYQLAGYDEADDTLQINNGEKIRYTKIKPGEYELYAYAEDANGHKSEVKKLLDLTINPPWWLKKRYLILYTLLSAFITYTLLKWREKYIIEKQNKKMEIEKVKMEMKALRAQMNPHFMFNAMNSIKGLILSLEEKKASSYLTKFATILRMVLSNSEKQLIILADEIISIKLYIEVEALRFDNSFNYHIHIDVSVDTSFIRIPPLILQPFVENAIIHGLLQKTVGNKNLNINISMKGDFLIIEIVDNGVGRAYSTAKNKTSNHESIGVKNTERRIKLHHKKNEIYIIDLMDSQGKSLGTKVIIKIYTPE